MKLNTPKKRKVLATAGIVILVAVIGFSVFKIREKILTERRNRAIVSYCEQYRWNDSRRNQDDEAWNADGIRLIGQTDFLCSEHLYLKPKVKKSTTGLCHGEDTTYYYRTQNYKTYNSVQDCLNSGGRLPYN